MNKYKTEIKWGLIFMAVALLWIVFEKIMGWHGDNIAKQETYTNLFGIVAIVVFVFALLDKRKKLGGYMTWKEGFISGAIITLVTTILSPLAQWITHKVISPEYFPNAIKNAVDSGTMDQESAESFFNLGSYIMQASIGGLIAGLITAAIVALFVNKKELA